MKWWTIYYKFGLNNGTLYYPEFPDYSLTPFGDIPDCYSYMFSGCSKLNYVKALFTTTPSSNYTSSWLRGVASSGTFVKNAAATWNVVGVNGVPEGWTV